MAKKKTDINIEDMVNMMIEQFSAMEKKNLRGG